MSDNKSALSMIHDPIQHELTKHIDMDRNFIKERIEEKHYVHLIYHLNIIVQICSLKG